MPLRTLTRSRGMAALSLDGLSLRLPIAAQRKMALKQEVKTPDSFATTPPCSSVGARGKRAISAARASSGPFISSRHRVPPRSLCFQTAERGSFQASKQGPHPRSVFIGPCSLSFADAFLHPVTIPPICLERTGARRH